MARPETGPRGERRPAHDATERMHASAFLEWPVLRQLRGADRSGRGMAVRSAASARLRPRIADADKIVKSVCPYCAVGCGQQVYVSDEKVVQIEGGPDSPVSRGRLCPKGSASLQLTTGQIGRASCRERV